MTYVGDVIRSETSTETGGLFILPKLGSGRYQILSFSVHGAAGTKLETQRVFLGYRKEDPSGTVVIDYLATGYVSNSRGIEVHNRIIEGPGWLAAQRSYDGTAGTLVVSASYRRLLE